MTIANLDAQLEKGDWCTAEHHAEFDTYIAQVLHDAHQEQKDDRNAQEQKDDRNAQEQKDDRNAQMARDMQDDINAQIARDAQMARDEQDSWAQEQNEEKQFDVDVDGDVMMQDSWK
jgi:hypothetical protein